MSRSRDVPRRVSSWTLSVARTSCLRTAVLRRAFRAVDFANVSSNLYSRQAIEGVSLPPNGVRVQGPHTGERPYVVRCNEGLGGRSSSSTA